MVVFGDKEEMTEMFENVHMGLFLVMCIFLASASLMLWNSRKTMSHWQACNEIAVDATLREETIQVYTQFLSSVRLHQ